MRVKYYLLALFLTTFLLNSAIFAQRTAANRPAARRTITVVAEPNAVVWIDDIRRGAADESGRLVIKNVPGGLRKMRVRADGFKEVSMNLAPAQKGEVKVSLAKTAHEAELAFQQAESSGERAKAIELYRRAIAARPRYAEAHLGLARALSGQGDSEAALQAIREARKVRPNYAEASAVEGRIYKSADEDDKAIASFKRAIAEGRGFQPEAHAGLGLLYREKAEGFGAAGDAENERKPAAPVVHTRLRAEPPPLAGILPTFAQAVLETVAAGFLSIFPTFFAALLAIFTPVFAAFTSILRAGDLGRA